MQAYLIDWMKYDPAAEIAKLHEPILVAQGTTDIQVSVHDAELLVAANSRAKLLKVDGMCHVLKAATTDRALQTQQVYTDPKLPLHPDLVKGVLAFLDAI